MGGGGGAAPSDLIGVSMHTYTESGSVVAVVERRAIFRWVFTVDLSKNQVSVLLLLCAGLSSVG